VKKDILPANSIRKPNEAAKRRFQFEKKIGKQKRTPPPDVLAIRRLTEKALISCDFHPRTVMYKVRTLSGKIHNALKLSQKNKNLMWLNIEEHSQQL
jgi:hypothetical protein